MTAQTKDYHEPPEAPTIERRLRFYIFQYIGIPLILLIPTLAIFGVFGESSREVRQSNDDLAVSIYYPERYRYEMVSMLRIHVQNNSGDTIPLVRVEISKNYIEQFMEIKFLPSVTEITEENYEVELEAIAVAEIRVVTIELKAEEYGDHQGTVRVTAEGLEPISLMIETFVFP
jgi:hypothetical protein